MRLDVGPTDLSAETHCCDEGAGTVVPAQVLPPNMSESKLDQIVKGAPRPATEGESTAYKGSSPTSATTTAKPASLPSHPSDPTSTLPSSPPQIYLNLLILEASLRSQYLTLRARRRQHTFFLLILSLWTAYFSYALFLRPREDGSGVGGSVYWTVEVAEKLALMGGMVTAMLMWGTGQWKRGVRWPRRWVGITNRGLRVINTKIVVINGPWWKELLSQLSLLFPYSSFFPVPGPSYQYVDHSLEKGRHHPPSDGDSVGSNDIHEEELAPGGDYIKLLLLPKPFSPDFRENWELYRAEYWEKENERRAQSRERIRRKRRELAREQGGWIWWTGWRECRPAKSARGTEGEVERTHRHQHHSEKDSKRIAGINPDSHSRTSSRSSIRSQANSELKPSSERVRRGSSNSSVSERPRKLKPLLSAGSDGFPGLPRLNSQSSTFSSAKPQTIVPPEDNSE